MTEVVIFSGGGDYADPWHPFAETSAALGELLAGPDRHVAILDSVDALRDAGHADLLVVNAANGDRPHERDAELVKVLLDRHVAGSPILAIHAAANLAPDEPGWEAALGGRWVPGVSMHPERGPMSPRITTPDHPVVDGIRALDTVDERYAFLRVDSRVVVLVSHEHDGAEHPLLWLHEHGPERVAYLALGHDVEAFAARGPRMLVQRSGDWLLGRR